LRGITEKLRKLHHFRGGGYLREMIVTTPSLLFDWPVSAAGILRSILLADKAIGDSRLCPQMRNLAETPPGESR